MITPQHWKLINSAPKNTPLLLACDTYDCGWCFEIAMLSDDGKTFFTESGARPHLNYSHWLDMSFNKLTWHPIELRPFDVKIMLLANIKTTKKLLNKTQTITDIVSAWYYEDEEKFYHSVPSKLTLVESDFTHFIDEKTIPAPIKNEQ